MAYYSEEIRYFCTQRTTPMHETVQLNSLSIGYKEKGAKIKYIAQGIQASLYGGQLTCLLGANGAGKSTLLRTLSAFQPPLKGEILIKGKPLNAYTNNERARLIGVVLTERPELQNMTVFELAGMGRSPYTGFWGNLSKADKIIVEEALRMVGMEEMATRMVETLSDGERQKVMIAKALAQQTSVIFLDEPTAFLDYPSKVDTMLLLRRLAHETGKTIFLSTHDVELALQTADMLWLMKRIRRAKSDELQATSGEPIAQLNTQPSDPCTHPSTPNPQPPIANAQPLTIGTPRELAENGALESFFTGKDFSFDKEEMRFVIKN